MNQGTLFLRPPYPEGGYGAETLVVQSAGGKVSLCQISAWWVKLCRLLFLA